MLARMKEEPREPLRLDRKTDAIAEAIRAGFVSSGQATIEVHSIRVSLGEWRKIARAVARQMGRPVETVASENRAWAVLRDWPADPREEAIQEAALRRAADAMDLLFKRGE